MRFALRILTPRSHRELVVENARVCSSVLSLSPKSHQVVTPFDQQAHRALRFLYAKSRVCS
jgi:hypothetical protein